MAVEITLAVRRLVEFVMRSGDISNGFSGSDRMLEGGRAHRRLQKAGPAQYRAEVPLSGTFEYRGFSIKLEGRADGIIDSRPPVVDEIKSTNRPLAEITEDYNRMHWAQAQCYAFLLTKTQDVPAVDVQLTYCELSGDAVKTFRRSFGADELEDFVYRLFDRYIIWAQYESKRETERDAAIKRLKFPFPRYRRGQRELAVAVYRTITSSRRLFAQAPTGIGKTISTLFPAVKAIGEGKADKIFYLTAKTVTRQVAEDAFTRMASLGQAFKTVTLTAKDKICPRPGTPCNPENCPRAKGYFDRVNKILFEILNRENFITRETLCRYADENQLCPFEFGLDVSEWVDCVICDYNYVFDPIVYLRRYFQNHSGNFVFLVDEAHNLVGRAREMFSASLAKAPFLQIRKEYKDKGPQVSKTAGKVNRCFLELRKKCLEESENGFYVTDTECDGLYLVLADFVKQSEKWLGRHPSVRGDDALLNLYFESLTFLKISALYDERYVTYIKAENKQTQVRLYCLDPSCQLSRALDRAKAAVLFSATLSPLAYYREILGGREGDLVASLPSPFAAENLCLLIAAGISTRFNDREKSCGPIAELIKAMVCAKAGNYIVFFPSYRYMEDVYAVFSALCPEIRTVVQESGMPDGRREAFLDSFREENGETLVGFCVLGGIFSEGIDLRGDRLIGTAVVGVGLPQISPELDLIRSYFKNKNNMGYGYAYMYPGMNKVLQAAGRVIRTESDRGVVLLIDDRFSRYDYRGLFPPHWEHFRKIRGSGDLQKCLADFWGGKYRI